MDKSRESDAGMKRGLGSTNLRIFISMESNVSLQASSFRSSSILAARKSIFARCGAGVLLHFSKALSALSTALFTSSIDAFWSLPIGSRVAGLISSKVWPLLDFAHSPFMNNLYSCIAPHSDVKLEGILF